MLDDRSSRFILVASSLAAGEEDHNWLAKATMTEAAFDALPSVNREDINFDDKIHLVGYSLDAPAVRRGGKAILKMFFKTTDKVQKWQDQAWNGWLLAKYGGRGPLDAQWPCHEPSKAGPDPEVNS